MIAAFVAAEGPAMAQVTLGPSYGERLRTMGPPPRPTVYLTTDDGPLPGTAELIQFATAERIPLTLFFVGRQIDAGPSRREVLAAAQANPMIQVANHSYTHGGGNYVRYYRDGRAVLAEFQRVHRMLGLSGPGEATRLPGRNFWRLPGLSVDDRGLPLRHRRDEAPVSDMLFASGFSIYGWDAEWRHDNGHRRETPEQVSRIIHDSRAWAQRPNHVVLLMHDIMFREAHGGTAALSDMVGQLRAWGYQFALLRDYLGAPGRFAPAAPEPEPAPPAEPAPDRLMMAALRLAFAD